MTIPSDDGLEPLVDTLCKELELEISQAFNANVFGEEDSINASTFGYMSEGSGRAVFTTNEPAMPAMAGENAVNPSALLQAAMMMLVYVDQTDIAARIYQAWCKVTEAGYHTPDMDGDEDKQLGTKEFAEMIISRLWR